MSPFILTALFSASVRHLFDLTVASSSVAEVRKSSIIPYAIDGAAEGWKSGSSGSGSHPNDKN